MVDWSQSLDVMDGVVAQTFDLDACVYQPRIRIDVNAPAGPDPARAAFPFMGTTETDPQRFDMANGRRESPDARLRHVGAEIVLTALVSGWPFEPRRGDAVESLGAVGGAVEQVYSISEIHRDGTARAAFYLNKAS